MFLERMLRDNRPSNRILLASTVTADHEQQEVSESSSIIGTLSLNAAGAEPRYLGSSSAFAFARFVEPTLRQVASSVSRGISNEDGHERPTPEPCLLPDHHTAVRLSNAYFQNIHPQYPFLHEPTFRIWEAALEDPFVSADILNFKPVPLYFLNMV